MHTVYIDFVIYPFSVGWFEVEMLCISQATLKCEGLDLKPEDLFYNMFKNMHI